MKIQKDSDSYIGPPSGWTKRLMEYFNCTRGEVVLLTTIEQAELIRELKKENK